MKLITLAEFRATGVDATPDELEAIAGTDLGGLPGRTYAGGTYVERMPEPVKAGEEWCLTIMNDSWSGPLSTLEALLYDFACVEVFDRPSIEDQERLMVDEWKEFCRADGFDCESADELLGLHRDTMTHAQRAYVRAFMERWERWEKRSEHRHDAPEKCECDRCAANRVSRAELRQMEGTVSLVEQVESVLRRSNMLDAWNRNQIFEILTELKRRGAQS